jgi:hypothetical protein
MRLHLGALDPVFAVTGTPTFGRHAVSFPSRVGSTTRRITWMYGISWQTKRGFVFIGVQFHEKQTGES